MNKFWEETIEPLIKVNWIQTNPGKKWRYDKTLCLKSRKKALEDTTKWVCETPMTFTDRVYHVGYIDDMTVVINKPKGETYEPGYGNTDDGI